MIALRAFKLRIGFGGDPLNGIIPKKEKKRIDQTIKLFPAICLTLEIYSNDTIKISEQTMYISVHV